MLVIEVPCSASRDLTVPDMLSMFSCMVPCGPVLGTWYRGVLSPPASSASSGLEKYNSRLSTS